MRVALIDHYDSFTFNVIDWLVSGNVPLTVDYVAFDDQSAMDALRSSPVPLVISPGPKRPEDAASTLSLTRALLGQVPILGICLGQQILAVATDGRVHCGAAPEHGTSRSLILGAQPGLLSGLPMGTRVGVYNSLVVDPESLACEWQVNAWCQEQREVQAMMWSSLGQAPAYGLQFHPESFLSEGAATILNNWIRVLLAYRSTT